MDTDIHEPIAVGYDGSENARLALRWAVDEALRLGEPLLVVHVLERPEDPAAWWIELAGRARITMEEAVQEVADRAPELTIADEVRVGDPAATLCEISAAARMLVLGSRGQGGLAGLLTGSVSVAVATHAQCPVVVVRRAPENLQGLPVVAGFDESEHARQALERAFAEAAVRDVGIIVVRAWYPPLRDPHGDGYLRPETIAEIETAERHVVDAAVDVIAKAYPQVPVRIRLVAGSAGAALTQAAQQAQLVVVGSRGHGAVSGLLLGSTGQYLLHHAACPVMIVHAGPDR